MSCISRRVSAAVFLITIYSLLAGCGGTADTSDNSPPLATTPAFQGKVMSGSQPIIGATVQMYAAGSSGYGSAATALFGSPVTTDATGAFQVSAGAYSCNSSSTQVYLVATGGSADASGPSNAALAMMSAWGNCGDLEASTNITINEVTTAAAVWSLAPFMSSAEEIGTSATNQSGLAGAFLTARLLADSSSGRSPSSSLPANATVESTKLYSLANVLASCVESSGGAPCSNLFAAVTSGTAAPPTNTTEAALRVVKNPGQNVAAIYALGTATYAGLSSAPSDWTMAIAMTDGGMSNPATVGVDSTGHAWVTSYSGIVSAFSLDGDPLFASGLKSDGSSENYGLTIDPSDDVWVTDGGANKISEFSSSGTLISTKGGISGGGISYPIAIASDAAGNIWVVNNGDASVTEISNDGTPLSPSTGYTGGGALKFAVSVAVDANNTPWIASQNGTVSHLSASGSLLTTVSCCTIPTGIAVDGRGDVWVADYHADAVVHVSGTSGTVLSTTAGTGGLSDPYNLAADGAGNVWVVNQLTGTVTEIAGSGSSAPGNALSPAAGYGADVAMQAPYGVAIDSSGSLWVTSYDDSRLIRFIGLATPVKTPLVSAPSLP